ncbi:response regulator [Cronbergia sp. UHCC 0137]|uniref:hybrid sensor histidine kinase/response regulator n=1 Tax=Cronbergia sp. UHCC 0137 TaxID=3110239 RepID=UPI002B202A1D|nr:response regulator [Cronbergia sp. UHCC 0137]MEA5616496.1 response regulator [Cronbergia sp. UHCC 0137]
MSSIQENSLILVVDDTVTNIEIISYVLKKSGFDVTTAIDAESAFKQIQSKPPDLILLDVIMPGIDGFETCKRLKQNPETLDIPVIFMTGVADTQSKVKGLKLGAVDYIIRPFEEEEVLARIKSHLQLRYLTRTLELQVTERTSALSQALKELQESQLQLVQREKMSALGDLVAGVAHEINNPIGFIAGNLPPAIEYIEDLFRVIDLYQKYYPTPVPELKEKLTTINLDYIRSDLPNLIVSMKEGVKRIGNISKSLRIFSRADSDRKVPYNIHDGLNSTLIILQHRLKVSNKSPDIQIIKDYGNLPLVECFPGKLNQVFMNILANAIDAIEELISENHELSNCLRPTIWIHTSLNPDSTAVIIRIKDNGVGMSDETYQKAFDYLFTTKPVGKGTGLGLSIARQIIVEIHGGLLKCFSKIGVGTDFIMEIPLY